MTDYGRGSGSEPWHPEDPLFGDVYDQGYPQQHPQQPQDWSQQGDWQDPYATGQQHQQYPQAPQQGYEQQYDQQQYPQHQHQQQYPQAPQQGQVQHGYPQQQTGYDGYGGGYEGYEGYGTGAYRPGQADGYVQDPYGGMQPQDPYGQQPGYYGQQQPQHPQPPQQQGYQQQDPFQGQPRQPQQPGGQQHPQQVQQAGPGQQAQPRQPGAGAPGAPDADEQRRPGTPPGAGAPGHPQEPGTRPLRPAPAETGDWDADNEADPRDHAFFADHDDDDDDADASEPGRSGGRRSGRSQGQPTKKRRSGCACVVVLAVLVGGVGGVGYVGYNMYESRFGPPPDFSGAGTGDVQVDIPAGSSATTMGNILKKAGVVKSVGAFTSAAGKNPKGNFIQAGVYDLHRQMSGAAAVTMMLDPKSQNNLIIAEGMRDKQIYAAIDTRLGVKAGTTEQTAHDQAKQLGLPSWADSDPDITDPLEGFLFPSRYSIAKGEKPVEVLKQMVDEADKQYAQFDMAAEAKKQGLSNPLQLVTVASLVQAEGKTDDDFRKMAKVVYNRMVPNNSETRGLLQFDSTYNYVKNSSQTDISTAEVNSLDSPYNTYKNQGLPPGPIGNPGADALKAAMSPDSGNWWYFISLDGKTTKFTQTKAEFDKLYQQYNSQ
nr:endolytic transglycosylase MltG [Streptomyces sp. SN-593]